jgi:hypothetical protein
MIAGVFRARLSRASMPENAKTKSENKYPRRPNFNLQAPARFINTPKQAGC